MWGQWIYIIYIILIQQKFSPDSLMNLYLWYVLFCIKFSLTPPFEISWHVKFSFVSLLEICYSHKAWINSKSQRESQWKSHVYSVSHRCCAFERSANKSCLEEWSVCETVREWSRYLNIGISGYFRQRSWFTAQYRQWWYRTQRRSAPLMKDSWRSSRKSKSLLDGAKILDFSN